MDIKARKKYFFILHKLNDELNIVSKIQVH
jgi:hypothetical protein